MKQELGAAVDMRRCFEKLNQLFWKAKLCSISPFEKAMKLRQKKRMAEAAALSQIM